MGHVLTPSYAITSRSVSADLVLLCLQGYWYWTIKTQKTATTDSGMCFIFIHNFWQYVYNNWEYVILCLTSELYTDTSDMWDQEDCETEALNNYGQLTEKQYCSFSGSKRAFDKYPVSATGRGILSVSYDKYSKFYA
jgi:hypothetical protein